MNKDMPRKPIKRKRKPVKRRRRKKDDNHFDPDEILVKKRNVFHYEPIDSKVGYKVIKELLALDAKKKAPIYFWLNTPGGCTGTGMAIIQTMRHIKSKVITIINTEVCSMGGHIAVAGNERWISKDGVFMAHDMWGGQSPDEYSHKQIARGQFLDDYYKGILNRNLKTYTNLTDAQLKKARTQELWLFAEDCIKYGVADKIIKEV